MQTLFPSPISSAAEREIAVCVISLGPSFESVIGLIVLPRNLDSSIFLVFCEGLQKNLENSSVGPCRYLLEFSWTMWAFCHTMSGFRKGSDGPSFMVSVLACVMGPGHFVLSVFARCTLTLEPVLPYFM